MLIASKLQEGEAWDHLTVKELSAHIPVHSVGESMVQGQEGC